MPEALTGDLVGLAEAIRSRQGAKPALRALLIAEIRRGLRILPRRRKENYDYDDDRNDEGDSDP